MEFKFLKYLKLQKEGKKTVNECYVTNYLQSKYNKNSSKDKRILFDMSAVITNARHNKDYNGPLKDYDFVGPKLVEKLKKLDDKEIDAYTYDRLCRIEYMMEGLYLDEAIEEADLLIAIIKNDINAINAALNKRDAEKNNRIEKILVKGRK